MIGEDDGERQVSRVSEFTLDTVFRDRLSAVRISGGRRLGLDVG